LGVGGLPSPLSNGVGCTTKDLILTADGFMLLNTVNYNKTGAFELDAYKLSAIVASK
jgi:hypothetical protein